MARRRSGDGRSARWQRSALVLLAVATAIGSMGLAAGGTGIMGPGVPVSAGPGWAWSNLDRTQPVLPLRPGLAERRAHDYIGHGTTALFAALEVATSKVTDRCSVRHRHAEFLAFCEQVAKAYPRRELHIVLDNYGTRKHPRVGTWLARNPRIRLHCTPTSASWMNLVEAFFGIITRQAIRRGAFTCVADLVQAIGVFIDAWNERCQPFSWTKTPQQILAKARRS